LAASAKRECVDAIAVSTYNGVALSFARELKAELNKLGLDLPILFGGRLNQIPETSNTSLPVDVRGDIRSTGALVCEKPEDAIALLAGFIIRRDKDAP